MTRDTDIAKIRKAAVAANPEIEQYQPTSISESFAFLAELIDLRTKNGSQQQHDSDFVRSFFAFDRPIRLADVLLAIGADEKAIAISGLGYFMELKVENGEWITETRHVQWNLKKDNLEDQSPECIHFIAELLPNV